MSRHPTHSTVVVFDLGNVLIPWERRGSLARFFDDSVEMERVAAEVFTHEVNLELDLGRPPAEVGREVERAHPGHGWVVEAYIEHFRHSLGPIMDGTVALLDELLAAGVRCLGLSNWSAITFEGVPEAYPAIQRLEAIVISGEVGLCKPDRQIFEHFEQRFDLRGEQIVFLDDSPGNVAGAHGAGWDAVLFVDAESARAELVRRGLLTNRSGDDS